MPNNKKVKQSEYDKLKVNHEKGMEQMILDMISDGTAQYENESGGIMTTDEYLFHKRKREDDHKKNFNPMELN